MWNFSRNLEELIYLTAYHTGNIVQENACRLDWRKVTKRNDEIYILGNPPYVGSSMQSKEQKEDMRGVFKIGRTI